MAATHLAPGSSVPAAQAREYEKIVAIKEDIFSGAHPRLRVPQQFVRKPASRPPTARPAQGRPRSGGSSPGDPPSQQASLQAQGAIAGAVNGVPGGSGGTAARTVPKPVSEIDPIFLTKSDDLVRAELQLQRQRVERTLRDQLDQKKQESRQKVSLQDAKPDFDVSDVLIKAFEMVKPSPSTDGNGAGQSDSSDDHSFYSSRAPDSPQQGPRLQPSPPAVVPPAEAGAEQQRSAGNYYSDELQRLEALNRTESDQEMQDTYPVTAHRWPGPDPRPARHHAETGYAAAPRYQEPPQPADALEEPEYSPPEPGVAPMERAESPGYQRAYYGGPPPRRGGPPHERARYMSPGADVRIVRNHIASPAAPQPSRVSPLAMTKVPSVHQRQDSRPDYGSDQQPSPHTSPQSLMPRKRRRVQEERARPRQTSYRSQAGGANEPFIKEEPVSPPPFADDAPTYRSRPLREVPVYIDVPSPRYTPVYQRVEPPPARVPAYEVDPYDVHGEPGGMQRTVSRVGSRRPMRDDQDLRRVASLHQARQPEYQREYVDQTSPRSVRAASYATFVERPPPQERTRYYQEPPPPPTRRYVPAEDSPPSPRYRDAYYDEDRVVAAPAAPRRIVVDEHGNQYYETIPQRVMHHHHPPAAQPYDDRPPYQQPSSRAPSVMDDPYVNRRYIQDMPPPPPGGTYRRVTEYPRPPPMGEPRPYTTHTPLDDRDPYPRSSSVQVSEYAPPPARRPPTYIDEAGIPRERIVRMPSVRPPTSAAAPVPPPVPQGPSRYEEPPPPPPREVIPRVESVRPHPPPPSAREVSTFVDDGRMVEQHQHRPFYVSRYYENANPERVMLDGAGDGAREPVRRVSQRY